MPKRMATTTPTCPLGPNRESRESPIGHPSKAALITDALVYWRPDLLTDDIPDTGSLDGDFDAIVERAARNDDGLISNDLVLRVALESAHDADLAFALDELMLLRGRRW